MVIKFLTLVFALLLGSASAASLEFRVDERCGLVQGEKRFDIGTDGPVLQEQLGAPTRQTTEDRGPGPTPSTILDYSKQALSVAYYNTDRKLVQFHVQLTKNPDVTINGVKVTRDTRALIKSLGTPTKTTSYSATFVTPGCQVTILDFSKDHLLLFLNVLDF